MSLCTLNLLLLTDDEPPGDNNIFSNIMKANQGSRRLRKQGDIAIKTRRNAIDCPECLWPKSSDGIVYVPYTVSSQYKLQPALRDLHMDPMCNFPCPDTPIPCPQNAHSPPQNATFPVPMVSPLRYLCPFRVVVGFPPFFTPILAIRLGKGWDRSESKSFSNTSGENTIVPHPNPNVTLGQGYGLSNLDVLNTLLSASNGTLTSVNYPSNYQNNTNCVWLIRTPSNQVTLKFDAFNVQQSTGCIKDYIRVYDGATRSAPMILDKTCGTGRVPVMIASTNHMLVEFVTDNAITATGFKASYSTVKCGGTFYTPSRNITTPNYPKSYRPNLDCQFLITAPPFFKVALNISDFFLEMSSTCKYDYLEIYNGDSMNAPKMGKSKYCGYQIFNVMVSDGRSMLLRFYSDDSVQMYGFKASYTFALWCQTSFCAPLFCQPPNEV
ncbi:hypothetical protein XELAEV_18021891mg [Xenopus laevis]|uniref:CUB domain-containing protein n=1 Tax=Xenopus laevis TaxID=8355 RepID=A0A974D2E9_XENLA|nr:hypothetical protein XELAEV_18021891mg [Xenopus laevis]